VHERRRLERLRLRLAGEEPPRHAPQLVVDQRHQLVDHRGAVGAGGEQQRGDRLVRHGSEERIADRRPVERVAARSGGM
jgi:hypothetical protein